MAKFTNEEIIDAVKAKTDVELNDLVKAIEAELGVTAADPVDAAAPAEEEAKKGPTEVTLTLKACGANKVQCIKAIQAITGLGLMDAKKLVDAAPSVVKEHISPVEAEEHKKALEATGAQVEIK